MTPTSLFERTLIFEKHDTDTVQNVKYTSRNSKMFLLYLIAHHSSQITVQSFALERSEFFFSFSRARARGRSRGTLFGVT